MGENGGVMAERNGRVGETIDEKGRIGGGFFGY